MKKEYEKRMERIKNSPRDNPVCIVYSVKETTDNYILKVVFNKKKEGLNEKRRIKLKKSYFSRSNKLTHKLYCMFELDCMFGLDYGYGSWETDENKEDKRNKKLFLALKKIGVVTEDNKIDITKFKGLVFEPDLVFRPDGTLNFIQTVAKNPKLHFDYFSYRLDNHISYEHKNLFKRYKGWSKDYEEFKKFDEQNVKRNIKR